MRMRLSLLLIALLPACALAQQRDPPPRQLIGRTFYNIYGPFDLSALIHLEQHGRETQVKLAPTTPLREALDKPNAAIRFDHSAALWRIQSHSRRDAWNSDENATLTLSIISNAKAEPRLRIESISVYPEMVRILGRPIDDYRMIQPELIIQPESWQLQLLDVSDPKSAEAVLSDSASDGFELLRQLPTEMIRFAIPMLCELNGGENPLRPGAADVYRAFPLLPAAAGDLETLRSMLAEFKNPDPSVREKALVRMSEASDGLVLAALRMDRVGLSPEQRLRLDALIASRATYGEPREIPLAVDPLFLYLLRDHEDVRIQTLASITTGLQRVGRVRQ